MGSEILTYLRLGLHHIADLRGYDHILFVAALTVAYRPSEWRRLLWLVTAFTLGHSITLALATLNLVRANAGLVETGIALTIVISSLMAIALAVRSEAAPAAQGQALRYTLAAVFGLIHGLGFSTFLRSLLGGEESIFVPLLSFNVGLELGQLLIVRESSDRRRVERILAGPATGCWWHRAASRRWAHAGVRASRTSDLHAPARPV
jgi:hypothetical protein